MPLDARMWASQVRSLGRKGEVLALDLPGFGGAPPAEPSLDAWARSLAATLRARQFEKAVLAGCSMGGYTALALLRVDPSLVAAIALVGSRTTPDSDAQRAARFAVIERITREGTGPWAREWVRSAVSPWQLEHQPDIAAEVQAIIASQPAETIITAQRAIAARPDSSNEWVSGALDASARLIVHGVDDAIIPIADANALAKSSSTRIVVVENAGHLAPMEQPEIVSEAIGELWLRCRSSR